MIVQKYNVIGIFNSVELFPNQFFLPETFHLHAFWKAHGILQD